MQSVNWTGHGHFENFKAPLEGEDEAEFETFKGFSYLDHLYMYTKSIKNTFYLIYT